MYIVHHFSRCLSRYKHRITARLSPSFDVPPCPCPSRLALDVPSSFGLEMLAHHFRNAYFIESPHPIKNVSRLTPEKVAVPNHSTGFRLLLYYLYIYIYIFITSVKGSMGVLE